MIKQEIKLYSIIELSDSSLERALNNFRNKIEYDFYDSFKALEEFASALKFEVRLFSVESFSECKFVIHNSAVRGIKLDSFSTEFIQTQIDTSTDCSLTDTLWHYFKESFKETGSAKLAIEKALFQGFKQVQCDYEYFYSKESIIEHYQINETLFFEDGNLIPHWLYNKNIAA